MMDESLSNAEWLRTIDRLGGAELLEEEAREFGAFKRGRKIECAVDQLRLVLAYCWGTRGLRLTVAWAEVMGLASLSNVALLKRLRNSADWLERLVCRLLGTGAGGICMAVAKGRPVRLVDATAVAKAGRNDRESGGVWRGHRSRRRRCGRNSRRRSCLSASRSGREGACQRRRHRGARQMEWGALARRRGKPPRSHRAAQKGARQRSD